MTKTDLFFPLKSIRITFCSLILLIAMASCASQKNKPYRQLEDKKTVFIQKKYKFVKGHPPIQRYFTKRNWFKPKK